MATVAELSQGASRTSTKTRRISKERQRIKRGKRPGWRSGRERLWRTPPTAASKSSSALSSAAIRACSGTVVGRYHCNKRIQDNVQGNHEQPATLRITLFPFRTRCAAPGTDHQAVSATEHRPLTTEHLTITTERRNVDRFIVGLTIESEVRMGIYERSRSR